MLLNHGPLYLNLGFRASETDWPPHRPSPRVYSAHPKVSVHSSFASLCLSLEAPRVQRDNRAQSLAGQTHLLQGVVRGVTEAAGAALQSAGLRHGCPLLIQQHLGTNALMGREGEGWARRAPSEPCLGRPCTKTAFSQENEPP